MEYLASEDSRIIRKIGLNVGLLIAVAVVLILISAGLS